MVSLHLGKVHTGRATGSSMALSIMNPTEVYPSHSRANSVLLHWICFDANLSFEGTVSWWNFLFVNSALPTLDSGLCLYGCFKFSDCNWCPPHGVFGVMAKLMLLLLWWR